MLRSTLPFGALALLIADPQACEAMFAHWRWPHGFICPHCKSQRATRIATRPAWRCLDCQRQTRLTAGTALHGSHLPLRHWLYAIFIVAQRKCSISAAQLQRDLHIGYPAAWFMLQRIRRFLAERPLSKLHRGIVEVASCLLDRKDARPHPRTPDICPTSDIDTLVIGIERRARGGHLPQLRFGRLRAIAMPAAMPITTLVDLHVKEAVRVKVIKNPIARMILQNITDCVRGTFHGVSSKHLPAYLQEHVFRFNRRRRPMLLPSFVGRRLAQGQRLPRAQLRTTAPGLDLPVRVEPTLEATAEPTAPLTAPATKELTLEEQENAALDQLLMDNDAPRNLHEDPRVRIKRLLGK